LAGKINKNKVIATAQKFVQKGNYDRAIREYTRIVEEDPRDVRVWLKIGDLHAKKNDKGSATDTYSKVAEFYSEQGFYLKAVAVYKQILRIDPTQVGVNLQLAELYKQLGLLNDAMKQYEEVSNYYHVEGRTKEALAALRQIVDLDPENVASRIKLAELYSREQMRDEAIEEFSRAADFLRADNRIDDFLKVSERLVFHQPDDVAAIKELANIYLQRQDPRRSLQKLQMAFKLDPRDEETLEMLAQAFQGLGQTTKTVSVLKELARIFADGGDEEKRLDIYQRVLVLAPSDEEAKEAVAQGSKPRVAAPQASNISAPSALDFPDVGEPAFPPSQPDIPVDGASPLPPFEESGIGIVPPPGANTDFEPDQTFDTEPVGQPPPVPDEEPSYDVVEYDAPPPAAEFETEVAKIITEADVYIKYGLQDKAIEHLEQVFERDRDNVEVRLKLKDLYVQMRQFQKASRELTLLARSLVESDRKFAADMLNEALELEPDNDEAKELLAHVEQSASGPFAYDGYDDNSSGTISLAEDDIVEEISMGAADQIDPAAGDATSPDAHAPVMNEHQSDSGVLTMDNMGGGDDEYAHDYETAPFSPVPEGGEAPPVRGQKEGGGGGSLEDDLEEAEFFIQQSLFSEARAILEELLDRRPGHPIIEGKLEELEEIEKLSQSRVVRKIPELGDSGLAAEVSEGVNGTNGGTNKDVHSEELEASFSVVDVFKDFKTNATEVTNEDSDTHYDLGIAYREMGLMDDAICEFKIAMQTQDKEVLCHMMIGLCFLDKGITTDAISQFKKALYVEGITDSETTSLYFELGRAYERLEDNREALYYFEKVAKKSSGFKDVTERIAVIKRDLDEEEPN